MRRKITMMMGMFLLTFIVGSNAEVIIDHGWNKMVVLDFLCKDMGGPECSAPVDTIYEEIGHSPKYIEIGRAKRDRMLADTGLRGKICGEDVACAAETGSAIGAGRVISGSIEKWRTKYIVYLMNVKTKEKEISISKFEECPLDEAALNFLIANMTRNILQLPPYSSPQERRNAPRIVKTKLPAAPIGEMVFIPAGEFMMGCNAAVDKQCKPDEKPYHKVVLDDFYIDKYEVSVAQYGSCVEARACRGFDGGADCNFGKPKRHDMPDCSQWRQNIPCPTSEPEWYSEWPMNCIEWDEAKTFCEWAGKRLPTEAEWEKAARGTDARIYPYGNEPSPSCDIAVMVEGNTRGCQMLSTWPIGLRPKGASPYGAMDMGGNVEEYTADYYSAGYYRTSPQKNPKGPAAPPTKDQFRVLRGGSYVDGGVMLRTSARTYFAQNTSNVHNGFRCAK